MPQITLGGPTSWVDLGRDRADMLMQQAGWRQQQARQREAQSAQQAQQLTAMLGRMAQQQIAQQQRKDMWAIENFGKPYGQVAQDFQNWQGEHPDGSFQEWAGQQQGRAQAAEIGEYKKQGVLPYGFKPYVTPEQEAALQQQQAQMRQQALQQQALDRYTINAIGEPFAVANANAQRYGLPVNRYVQIRRGEDPDFEWGLSPDQIRRYDELGKLERDAQVSNDPEGQIHGQADAQHYATERAKLLQPGPIPRRGPNLDLMYEKAVVWKPDKNDPDRFIAWGPTKSGQGMEVVYEPDDKKRAAGQLVYGGFTSLDKQIDWAQKRYQSLVDDEMPADDALKQVDQELQHRQEMVDKFKARNMGVDLGALDQMLQQYEGQGGPPGQPGQAPGPRPPQGAGGFPMFGSSPAAAAGNIMRQMPRGPARPQAPTSQPAAPRPVMNEQQARAAPQSLPRAPLPESGQPPGGFPMFGSSPAAAAGNIMRQMPRGPARPQAPTSQPAAPRPVMNEQQARAAPQSLPRAPLPESGQPPVEGAFYQTVDEHGRPMVVRYYAGKYYRLE